MMMRIAFAPTLAAALLCCAASAPPCDDAPAVAYLHTGSVLETSGEASLILRVRGGAADDPGRPQQFTFAHGTLQRDIIITINAFAPLTHIAASQSALNPSRVELYSLSSGASAFLTAEQLSLPQARLHETPHRGDGAFELTVYGRSELIGDLDCDGAVGTPDLLILLAAWGECGESQCAADLSGDGTVNALDLLMLLGHWSCGHGGDADFQ